MLPLYLISAIKGETITVELKTGGIVRGTLENCDNYMNVTLVNAYSAIVKGDEFHKIDRIYLKGMNIKLFKIDDKYIDKYKEQQQREKDMNHRNNNNNSNNNNNNNANRNRNFNNQRRNYRNNNNNNNNNRNFNKNVSADVNF